MRTLSSSLTRYLGVFTFAVLQVAVAGRPFSETTASAPTPHAYDDGSTEDAKGIRYGGGPANTSIAWMNGFTVQAGHEIISQISLTFGTPTRPSGLANRQPVTIYLWSNPNGDGNPVDAKVLRSARGFTRNVDTDTFNVFPITPITLPAGTNFFVGAILRQRGFQAAASVDLNSSDHNSWFRGWSPGIIPDPNNMGFNEYDEPAFVNLDSTGEPGAFMIRAK